MSYMKCPFCQQELEIWHTNKVRMYACPDLTCKGYYMSATKDMWQELIRTRKALDCAINTLDTVYGMSEDDGNIETYIKCKRIEINGIIKGYNND